MQEGSWKAASRAEEPPGSKASRNPIRIERWGREVGVGTSQDRKERASHWEDDGPESWSLTV